MPLQACILRFHQDHHETTHRRVTSTEHSSRVPAAQNSRRPATPPTDRYGGLAHPVTLNTHRLDGETAAWGSREPLNPILIGPDLVAEASADTAIDHGGVFRHPLRYARLRLDITVDDVPRFGEETQPSAG
jgi:hypothetical protein